MFRAHVLIARRAKLYYTVTGIITHIGGPPVHRLTEKWMECMEFHAFHPVLSQSVYGTATYRCNDARDCIIQFCPPDDEHMCSKHVEAWNKLIIKFSASSWLILMNKKKRILNIRNYLINDEVAEKCWKLFWLWTVTVAGKLQLRTPSPQKK